MRKKEETYCEGGMINKRTAIKIIFYMAFTFGSRKTSLAARSTARREKSTGEGSRRESRRESREMSAWKKWSREMNERVERAGEMNVGVFEIFFFFFFKMTRVEIWWTGTYSLKRFSPPHPTKGASRDSISIFILGAIYIYKELYILEKKSN